MKSTIREYECFKDLAAAHKQGDDYDVETRELSLHCVFVAPHGKEIEPETEFIARELAGDDFSFHVFEGRLPPRDHNLHITSHRYDEPTAIDLVKRCRIAVGIHGRHSKSPRDEEIWMGGLNGEKLIAVSKKLIAAGFKTRTAGHKFPAIHPKNICNRAKERGIQLEMTLVLRRRLRREAAALAQFSNAIRAGLGI